MGWLFNESNVDPFGLSPEGGDITVYYGDYWGGKEHKDLLYGDMSKKEMTSLPWINWSDFFLMSEAAHISSWYTLVNALSYGATQQILVDMMHHFLDGSGSDYSNALLTEKVAKHDSTIAYMEDFTKVFNEFVLNYQGNITAFANSESFKKELRNNNVYFTAYDYWGNQFLCRVEQ